MITLFPWGYSIGDVHSVEYSEIAFGQVTAVCKASFDTTSGQMVNEMVPEYLNNLTVNQPIRNANDIIDSDKHVLAGHDGCNFQVPLGQ
jgi:hypothetical protein